MQKAKSGFTIVELLIVIVVIAILAAISIVAYNGIQVRARNTQQITSAKTYLNTFASYLAANSTYPGTDSSNRLCVGIDPASCSTAAAGTWGRSTTLENGLKTIASTLPTPNTSSTLASSPRIGYVPASDVTLDGVANPFFIFTIESPGTCTVSGLASGTWPTFTSTVPSQGYTFTDTGMRVCMIAMPRA